MKGGDQLSAAIYSKEPVDVGGGTAHPVRLIFRDHPEWGRSSYLVLENGDFDCYGGCKVKVTLDDARAEGDGGLAPEDRRGDRDVHRGRARAVAHDARRRRR